MKNIIIAIDGLAASGKGTIARQLAKELTYTYVDTGALYRAVTYYLQTHHIQLSHKDSLLAALTDIHIELRYERGAEQSLLLLNGNPLRGELRSMEVNQRVSEVAATQEVRDFLLDKQRALGQHKKIVMDGRDIGTHIFPHAEVKLFITAELHTRARRRYEELRSRYKEKEDTLLYEEILQNLNHRDTIDTTRSIHPLEKAPDAIVIDNTELSVQEQFDVCMQYVRRALS